MSAEPEQAPVPTFPDALRPPLPIGKPNERITLYEGPIDFTQGGKDFRADGQICFRWLPSPAICFESPNLPDGGVPRHERSLVPTR